MHHMPGPVHGDGGAEAGRRVEIQVSDLGAYGADGLGLGKAEMPKHTLRFIADMAQMDRNISTVTQGIAQRGIGHGGGNGVRIGISVTGYINLVHKLSSCERFFSL